MSKVTFISFYGAVGIEDNGWKTRQDRLHSSAIEFGKVDSSIQWSRSDLIKTAFYQANCAVLDEPRGGGLWAWKPWAILETLKQVKQNDYVVYHDIGKPFRDGTPEKGGLQLHGNIIELPLASIIQWAEEHDGMFPGVNTPHYGPASQWTKRDCFVGMQCDQKEIWDLPLVQAGYNAWKNTPAVVDFLKKWLINCCDRRLISDDKNVLGKPDFPNFSEHRHDQSILTNLIRREGVQAYGSTTNEPAYVRNFNYLVRRIGLEQSKSAGETTLTGLISNNGGSQNLPISVTNWADLDLANRVLSTLRVLIIRAKENAEETQLRAFFQNTQLDTLDLSQPEEIRNLDIENQLHSTGTSYDWIFAYGFEDQALLVHISKIAVRRLKPMGYMVAGLDHSLCFVKDNTFNQFIGKLSYNRNLPASTNSTDQSSRRLIVGTATNPVLSKKRRGKTIIASIQAGLPSSYYD